MLCRVSKAARSALAGVRPAAVVKAKVRYDLGGKRIVGLEERMRGMMSWCMITVLDLPRALGPDDVESTLEHVLGQCSSLSHLDLSFNGIGPEGAGRLAGVCLLYTSPSPRDVEESRMPSSA